MNDYREEITQYIINNISDYEGTDGEELHNNMFNTDYYIIGTYKAKEWCGNNTFDIIGAIKEYEQNNFGEINTDLSNPEQVVNMYAYILGEEILGEFWDLLNGKLTSDKIKEIKEGLEG